MKCSIVWTISIRRNMEGRLAYSACLGFSYNLKIMLFDYLITIKLNFRILCNCEEKYTTKQPSPTHLANKPGPNRVNS